MKQTEPRVSDAARPSGRSTPKSGGCILTVNGGSSNLKFTLYRVGHPLAFKTIVEGALAGGLLTVLYFLCEGVLLANSWIAVNWLLDFMALLPFADITVPRYFLEIGLRYLAIVAPTVSVGYVLERTAGQQTA